MIAPPDSPLQGHSSTIPPQLLKFLDGSNPGERWILGAEIGAGGMGKVEEVYDRRLERHTAMKTLHRSVRDDRETVRRFLQEARITGGLEHPNIVPVHELGCNVEGHLYFTMTRVHGKTLTDLIYDEFRDEYGPEALYPLLDIFARVCDAVAFAHSRGVIHCDLKPDNILVGDFGQVYLMDWGISRIVDPALFFESSTAYEPDEALFADRQLDGRRLVAGTANYMSPEQAEGRIADLDRRSDVFSLSVVLYEILTQSLPFESETIDDTIERVLATTFVWPERSSANVWIPKELERIVEKGLARDPKDRYTTIEAMKDDIVRFVRGGGEFPKQEFAEGEAIVTQGDVGDAAYVVMKGSCAVFVETDGKRVRRGTISPGELFGETAILAATVRTATVIALEPTTVTVIRRSVFEQEIESMKPWLRGLLKTLASRFRDSERQISELISGRETHNQET